MLNKKIIAKNFSKATSNYDKEAVIQWHAARKLCEISAPFIKNISNKKIKIIDFGSGTSTIYKNFILPKESSFFEVDLSLTMLRSEVNKSTNAIVADIENLPLKNESFDVIISSFSLQWLEDFEKNFSNFYKILKKDGILAFCIPNNESLKNLEEASQKSGCNFHFNKLPKTIDLQKTLENCGFVNKYNKSEIAKLEFSGAIEALKHLKRTGANYLGEKKFITKKQLQHFDQYHLENQENNNKKFTFLWNISYFIFQKH